MSKIIEIKTEEQYKEVINTPDKKLLIFGSSWCGPCGQLKNSIIDNKNSLNLNIYTIDVDVVTSITSSLGIRSIPALVVFKDGKELARKIGYTPLDILLDWYNSF